MRLSSGIVAMLLTGTIAGCLGGDDAQIEQSAAPVAAVGPLFLPSLPMDQDFGAAEPNIAVLPDGTLFVTAPVALEDRPNLVEGAAWLWRSTDGGATWETLRAPEWLPVENPVFGTEGAGLFCSCDADVVGAPDGWVYYTDWWIAGLAAGNYLVEASGDGGATWQHMPITIPVTDVAIDRQWLLGGDGYVGLFYSNFDGDVPLLSGGWSIQAVFSGDHGMTWSQPVAAVPADATLGPLHGKPFITPTGTIVLPFAATEGDYLEGEGEVRVALSHDQGATWEQVTASPRVEMFDNVWPVEGAVDDAGRIYVAWSERDGDVSTVKLAVSTDDGMTWGAPVALTQGGNHALPWVAARGDGVVAVGWYGGTYEGDPADAPDGSEWFAFVAGSSDAGATFGTSKASPEPVKTGGFCPRGGACGGEDRDLLDYLSMVYDPTGNLHVAFARQEAMAGFVQAHIVYAGTGAS